MDKLNRCHNLISIKDDYVIKRFINEEGFDREIKAIRILKSNEIVVPKIIKVDEEERTIVYKKFKYSSGIEHYTKSRIRGVARILKKIHSIKIQLDSSLEDQRFPLYNFSKPLIQHINDKYIQGLEARGYFLKDVSERIKDLESRIKPPRFAYIHGDAKFNHYFFDKTQIIGVIDFEYFGIFDPLLDVGNIAADMYETSKEVYSGNIRDFCDEYDIKETQFDSVLLYMITSRLTRALNIDLPLGKMASVRKSINLANKFAKIETI